MLEYYPERFSCCSSKRLKPHFNFCPECGAAIPRIAPDPDLKRRTKYRSLMDFADAIERRANGLEAGLRRWSGLEDQLKHYIASRRRAADTMRKRASERYGGKP